MRHPPRRHYRTTDVDMVEALKKARKLMVAAKEIYWKASAILWDDIL